MYDRLPLAGHQAFPHIILLAPHPVPHHEEGVETEGGVHDQLVRHRGGQERRQPARLARVHEKEDEVVGGDQVSQLLKRRSDFRLGAPTDRVARHRDGQHVAAALNSRANI